MTGLLLVVCSTVCHLSNKELLLLYFAGPATADARSPKLVFERGTWRSPCAAERSRERAMYIQRWSTELTEIFWCGAMDSIEEDRACSTRISGRVASQMWI